MVTPPPDEVNRARLRELLEQRVKDLGLKWHEVAERSGYSQTLLRTIRRDPTYPITPGVARALDQTLRWNPGVSAILSGRNPVTVDVDPPQLDDGEGSPMVNSDMEVLLYWSRRMPDVDFALLSEHIARLRVAAYEEGKRAGRRQAQAGE